MELDHATSRRLAFIRYLLQTSMSQSAAPHPLSCSSILTMHDAVELFFQLASEHLNAGKNDPRFMDYWDLLNPKLKPRELHQKESMRRLNKARVALKHSGTFPSQMDIASFRTSTASFFEDNVPLVFGLALDEVSLIEFVNPESARALLKEAQDCLSRNDSTTALQNAALAFDDMLFDYETKKTGNRRLSPFYFGSPLPFLSPPPARIETNSLASYLFKLSDFARTSRESIDAIQVAIRMLALKIDYRKYVKFRDLTPTIRRNSAGESHVLRPRGPQRKPSV